jgi:phosphatidylinositol-3-phosphatase
MAVAISESSSPAARLGIQLIKANQFIRDGMLRARPHLRLRLGLALLLVVIGLAGCGGGGPTQPKSTPTPTPNPSPTPSPTPAIPTADHVFLVVLENHSFSTVIGNPVMLYLNALAAAHSLAANYFANAHQSIADYFMLTTGQIESSDNNFSGTVADDNVVRAISGAGKTWKAYIESLPAAGYTGKDVYPYVKHHNPFSYLTDVLDTSVQAANIVPLTQLSLDLSSGTAPAFAFIVPNIENDAHDCPQGGLNCADSAKLAAADNWLKNNIDPLINSPGFANSVLIITWDEGDISDVANGGGQVATVLVGVRVKTAFQSQNFYQHQSTLRLILDLLQVSDHPGASAGAPAMQDFFQ